MTKSKRIFVFAALLFSILCFPADQVQAESDTAEVPLKIQQSFEVKNNGKEADLTGNYEIRAMDADTPMPEGTKKDRYSFSLKGQKAETTISLRYVHAGVYHYQLLQTTEDKELYQYDRSCYDITVYVENGKDGRLIPQVTAKKEDGKKYGKLEFQNTYLGKKTESSQPSKPGGTDLSGQTAKPVKTGDSSNITWYALTAAGALLLIMIFAITVKHKRKNNRV